MSSAETGEATIVTETKIDETINPTSTSEATSKDVNSTTTEKLVPTKQSILKRVNFNIYWLFGAIMGIWFTVGFGFPLFASPEMNQGPYFGIHLVSVFIISMVCIINILLPPAVSPTIRRAHKILGWIGMVFGLIGVITGIVVTFYELRERNRGAGAIAITVGGFGQLFGQVLGISFLRFSKKRHTAITGHLISMHTVFFLGCLIPMSMRLPKLFNFEQPHAWTAYSWSFPLVLCLLSIRATIAKTWY